jgi:hypothetical protein
MKSNSILAAAAVALLQSQQAQASPVNHLVARVKVNVAEIIGILGPIFGLGDLLKDEPELAW